MKTFGSSLYPLTLGKGLELRNTSKVQRVDAYPTMEITQLWIKAIVFPNPLEEPYSSQMIQGLVITLYQGLDNESIGFGQFQRGVNGTRCYGALLQHLVSEVSIDLQVAALISFNQFICVQLFSNLTHNLPNLPT